MKPQRQSAFQQTEASGGPLEVSTATPRSLVALLACASGLSVANVYYAQPLLNSLANDFQISLSDVGVIITAMQIGSAMALLLLVPLGDRINRKRLMLAQAGALIVSLVAVGLANSSAALLIGMLAVGLLGTAMTQGLIAYAASVAGASERGRVVGAAQGGVVAGLLLARVFAGLVSDLFGWRCVYFVAALLMLVVIVALQRALPKPPPPAQRLPYLRLIYSMFTLLRRERVLQIRGTIALLMFAALSIFWSALSLLLTAPPLELSHSAVGAFGLVGAFGALAAASAGRLADRGYGQRTTGWALLVLLASWLPMWFATAALVPLMIGVIALDLAGQAIHVTNQNFIFKTLPEAHSRLVGCYMLFYSAGYGLGAFASTTVYTAMGWRGVCVLGAAVSFSALVFWGATLRFMPTTVTDRPRSS